MVLGKFRKIVFDPLSFCKQLLNLIKVLCRDRQLLAKYSLIENKSIQELEEINLIFNPSQKELVKTLLHHREKAQNDPDGITITIPDIISLLKQLAVHPQPKLVFEFISKTLLTVNKPKLDSILSIAPVVNSDDDNDSEAIFEMLASIAKFKTIWFTPVFSQEGEELIIEQLLAKKENGFYIDVGCHHPYRFSNTFHLYRSGWTGINIDPIPGTKKLFDKYRPKDLNLEIGISDKNSEMIYYEMTDSALNSFDKQYIDFICTTTPYKMVRETPVKVTTLKSLLDGGSIKQKIDVLSVDVEGHEINVLHGNDWTKYRPAIIVVEILDFKIEDAKNNIVHAFLEIQNYKFVAMTPRSIFYRDMN